MAKKFVIGSETDASLLRRMLNYARGQPTSRSKHGRPSLGPWSPRGYYTLPKTFISGAYRLLTPSGPRLILGTGQAWMMRRDKSGYTGLQLVPSLDEAGKPVVIQVFNTSCDAIPPVASPYTFNEDDLVMLVNEEPWGDYHVVEVTRCSRMSGSQSFSDSDGTPSGSGDGSQSGSGSGPVDQEERVVTGISLDGCQLTVTTKIPRIVFHELVFTDPQEETYSLEDCCCGGSSSGSACPCLVYWRWSEPAQGWAYEFQGVCNETTGVDPNNPPGMPYWDGRENGEFWYWDTCLEDWVWAGVGPNTRPPLGSEGTP